MFYGCQTLEFPFDTTKMCILFVYVTNNPDPDGYQVILASNRDEMYHRPTVPATRWRDHPDCISGFLVSDYLRSELSADEYTAELTKHGALYDGFNLVLLERKKCNIWKLHYFSPDEPSSPHDFEPERQKVVKGREMFSEIVERHRIPDKNSLVESLFTLLDDSKCHIPDAVFEASIREDLKGFAPQLSAIHVECPEINYGTRTKSLILVDARGNGEFIEKTMREPIDIRNAVWDLKKTDFQLHHESSL